MIQPTIRPLPPNERLYCINAEHTNLYIHFAGKDAQGNAHFRLREGRDGAQLYQFMRDAVNMLKFFQDYYKDRSLKLEPVTTKKSTP